jgi:hypothetical protein
MMCDLMLSPLIAVELDDSSHRRQIGAREIKVLIEFLRAVDTNSFGLRGGELTKPTRLKSRCGKASNPSTIE